MEVVKLTKDKYKDWNQFCLDSDSAWWYNTTNWLEYNLAYKPENKPESKSFMIVNNGKILAICSLIKEGHEFSFGEGYGPTPAYLNDLTQKQERKVMKQVFQHIDNLAKEDDIRRVRMRFPVLSESYDMNNYLTLFGYLDTSIQTRCIDLSNSLEELRADIRHGHDSDIDKATKELRAEIYDDENITRNIFSEYKNLHHLASGRKTRPDNTFDMLYDNIKNGNGFLVGALKGDEYVSFAYFTVYKGNVNYGSSCNKPDINLPLAHFVQWEAMIYMHQFCDIYEIGWQQYGYTLSDFPTPKEINIGKFKRGFGGFTLPLFRGEKFYDKDYFLKVYEERVNKYVERF